jgi:hypothetical protein
VTVAVFAAYALGSATASHATVVAAMAAVYGPIAVAVALAGRRRRPVTTPPGRSP